MRDFALFPLLPIFVMYILVHTQVTLVDPVLRIHVILGWIRIRIRGAMPLTNGSGSGSWIRILDPDPAIFVIDLQDASKKLIFQHNFVCLLLFEASFTPFFKDNK